MRLKMQNKKVVDSEANEKKDKEILSHMDHSTPEAKNAGLFIVHFDPSTQFEGLRGKSSDVIPNEKDNVASVLRKASAEIQCELDEYSGIDENNTNKRVYVSHANNVSENEAYCTVTCVGYDMSDPEISAIFNDRLSASIDKHVFMDWNENAYPITEAQIKNEINMEQQRHKQDVQFAGQGIPKTFPTEDISADTSLNETLVKEPSVENDSPELPW